MSVIKQILARDHGILPDKGMDCCASISSLLAEIKESNIPANIVFEKGRYDFLSENAEKIPYFISNTASEQENPDVTKKVVFHMTGMHNLTIEGNDTLFIMHGRCIPFVIDNCQNITIRNISLDYERATMSEMRVTAIGDDYIDFDINKDSWYSINRDRLIWEEDGFSYKDGPSQEYDPTKNITWRTWNPVSVALSVKETEPFKVRFFYNDIHQTKVGNVFQMRDGLRDQVGTFIQCSKNVSFFNVAFHYMHGLGIVSQFSENLTFNKINCSPRPETGRIIASAADFMHFSGCKGRIGVYDSKFIGSHDDPINIHGTYLKIIKIIDSKKVLVRFMHPQTYGFDAFFVDDEVEIVDPLTLLTIAKSIVTSTLRINNRDFELELKEDISKELQIGDVIENTSYTPSVEIINNYFGVVSTRGILVTTRKKVLIKNNYFDGMQMSGILISNDAKGWYESGRVEDVTISDNTFNFCADPVIGIIPENMIIDIDKPVHKNITIEGNTFIMSDTRMLYANSTQGIIIKNNIIKQTVESNNPLITLTACTNFEITNNCINNSDKKITVDVK